MNYTHHIHFADKSGYRIVGEFLPSALFTCQLPDSKILLNQIFGVDVFALFWNRDVNQSCLFEILSAREARRKRTLILTAEECLPDEVLKVCGDSAVCYTAADCKRIIEKIFENCEDGKNEFGE